MPVGISEMSGVSLYWEDLGFFGTSKDYTLSFFQVLVKFASDTNKKYFCFSPAEKIEIVFIMYGYDSNTEQAVLEASQLGLQHLDSSSRMLLHTESEREAKKNEQDDKTHKQL